MSLRCYTGNEEQTFLWDISGETLFGLQNSAKNKLLKIYGAEYATNETITSIKAIKINTANEIIDETDLPTDLIGYYNDQYQTLDDKLLVNNLDECIYYLEFNNGTVFKTEPFKVINISYETNNFVFMSGDNFVFMSSDNFILNSQWQI